MSKRPIQEPNKRDLYKCQKSLCKSRTFPTIVVGQVYNSVFPTFVVVKKRLKKEQTENIKEPYLSNDCRRSSTR